MLSEWLTGLVLLLGAACFSFGAWLAWHPAGYMIAGLLLGVPAFLLLYGREARQRNGQSHGAPPFA